MHRVGGTDVVLLQTNEQAPDRTLMSDRVVADAKRLYGGLVSDIVLEQCAIEATAEVWADPIKVTSFVPVLALRRVREMLAEAGEFAPLQQVVANPPSQIDT